MSMSLTSSMIPCWPDLNVNWMLICESDYIIIIIKYIKNLLYFLM